MSLINIINENVGFPFGIRGTICKYLNSNGLLPNGNTGSSGLSSSNVLYENVYKGVQHFFICDNVELSKHGLKINGVIKNSITKSIEEYSRMHNIETDKNKIGIGPICEENLPILFSFPLNENYILCSCYSNGKENTVFEYHKGKPTLRESYSGQTQNISSKGVFEITPDKARKIDAEARNHIKTNLNNLFSEIKPEDHTSLQIYRDCPDQLYQILVFYARQQKYFKDIIPKQNIFNLPTKKEFFRAVNICSDNELRSLILPQRKVKLVDQIYSKLFYENSTKKIIEEIYGKLS